MTLFIGCFVVLFLIGALPTAYIVTRALSGKDIRQYGSGNVGATNAFRVLGKGPGIFVFAVDFLKGWLPVYVCFHSKIESVSPNVWIWLAVAPVLGHIFTPFLGFRGGKGIATGAGILLAIQPLLFVLAAGFWLLSFAMSRIASVSSLMALAPLPAAAWALKYPFSYVKILIFLAILLIWSHRSNIGRLLRGEEKGIGGPKLP